jgi:uncharacterized protein (TIGR02145 family)
MLVIYIINPFTIMKTLRPLLLAFVLGMAAAKVDAQQAKYALIIGVKSYQYVQPLQNSLNDAHDMAATLKEKGFTVVELYDPANKRVMQDGILQYFKLLQAQPNAAGLVFYSGHGMQVKGINYLIPTQADPQIEADLDDQCVNMDYVMRAIEQAGNGLNIFVLDACRNNPFRSFSRSSERGLSMVETPKGSYIVYATKPGSVASDGTGRNGLFTSKLLQYINTEGLNIEQVFKRTAHDVAIASADAQRPWIASDYTGDFFFTPGKEVASFNNSIQPVAQPIVKAEEPKPDFPLSGGGGSFDYGYGTFDARTVTVGKQEWLGKNLNVDRFANGEPILEARTEEEWKRAGESKQPAWCYYENEPSKGRTYGRLYNWYAVKDPRGLAPHGWHIPSDAEWTNLIDNLGGGGTAGLQMKNISGWDGNGNGNNNSGIAGLPGGNRDASGIFYNLGKYGSWWSSSGVDSKIARYVSLGYDNSKANKDYYFKRCGFSVRCLRD